MHRYFIVPIFLFFYCSSCCFPEWLPPEKKKEMKSYLDKTYRGKIQYKDGSSNSFILRVEHDSSNDHWVSLKYSPFGFAFAASQCAFPYMGVKGSFSSSSPIMAGLMIKGRFDFFSSSSTHQMKLSFFAYDDTDDRPIDKAFFSLHVDESKSILIGSYYDEGIEFKGKIIEMNKI